ncbi:glycosyltransferase family 4 protein [Saccharicrinis sp. 156]|uniref:glycosyltransferase family 4 protein n=1 Tax=Saccharicrinis sp. 156 TaxID=3417574 RepID=UPI003D33C344
MRIGFDAKRAFFNTSGLGNYSRNLISNLSKFAPENEYVLFKNQDKKGIDFTFGSNTRVITPQSGFYKRFHSLWRTYGKSSDISKNKIDVYHGLSHELPVGIKKANVKSVVTMHDVIFLRFPELFSPSYRYIFTNKYKHACQNADDIVAISEQSKMDVIKYFNVAEEKIKVVYQGCNPIYYDQVSTPYKEKMITKYNLPKQFILYVGTIEKRKNALGIIEALHDGNLDLPLIIIGRPTDYKKEIEAYISKNNIQSQVTFLHGVPTRDLPALYQLSLAFVYPSLFEGFGIPILEALNSGTPVITSKGSCFPEVGGNGAQYVEYGNKEEMIEVLKKVASSVDLRKEMISKGYNQALKFREDKLVADMIRVYKKLL